MDQEDLLGDKMRLVSFATHVSMSVPTTPIRQFRFRANGSEHTRALTDLPQDEAFFRLFTMMRETRPHLFGPVLKEVK